jgi:hypothetical protein
MPQLPYPFEHDGELIEEFEVKAATTSTIAAAQKNTLPYAAMKAFLTGILASLNGNSNEAFLKNAAMDMPFESAFTALVYGMCETKETDVIAGEYRCPRCGAVRRTEEDDREERIFEFPIRRAPVQFQFQTGGVELVDKIKGTVLETVDDIVMTAPTLDSLIRGERRHPDNNIFTQSFACAQSIVEVNGAEADRAWRDKFGEVFFNKLPVKKMNEISKALAEHSPFGGVERVCLSCSHRWKAKLDFTNFFDFGAV